MKRTIILLAIAANLAGISESLEAYPIVPDGRPSRTAVSYGTHRRLTRRDFRAMQSLNYPQSERAFVRRFGSGSFRDRDYNYHRINGDRYLRVRVRNRRVWSFSY